MTPSKKKPADASSACKPNKNKASPSSSQADQPASGLKMDEKNQRSRAYHKALHQAKAAGMSADEARSVAREAFRNVELMLE